MIQTSQNRELFRHTLSKAIQGVFVALLAIVSITSVISLKSTPAQAASAKTLNFQARLLASSGAIVPDGTYNIEFKLYSVASGGSALWTETWYDSNGATAGNDNRVQVKAGYVSVYLGDQTDLPANIWNQQLWLTMNIGGTTQTATPTWDGEMSPRLRLTAVPAAYSLTNYNTVTGFSSSLSLSGATGGDQTFTIPDQGAAGAYTLLTSNAGIQNQNAADQTANFRISGTGRANTALQAPLFDTATAAALAIGTTNATSIDLNQNTTIASTKSLTVTAGATSLTGLGAGSSTALTVNTGATTNKGIVVQGVASQTANALEVQDNSGNVNLAVNAAGNQLTLGRVAGSGTVTQGILKFADGTTSNFSASIESATLTADRRFILPDTTLATTASPGTICVYNGAASNCPAATGSAFYIQNGTTVQTSANFYIRSAGTTSVGGVIEGANGQTADLLNLNSYNGTTSTTVAKFTAAGNLNIAATLDVNSATGLNLGTTNATSINIGNTSSNITTTVTGLSVFKPSTGNDSTTAFQIQNAAGTGIVFNADTTNQRIGIGSVAPQTKLEVVGDIISKGTAWTSRTSSANISWRSVAYGNGRFVAVANSGTGNRVSTSPDGINWTTRTPAVDNDWKSVTYGNGLFVAVSNTGTGDRVMTSTDGITWTSRTSATDNNWTSVTYGNGLFVAVGATGTNDRVMTSPDGIHWTSRVNSVGNAWQSVTFGNGVFVAVANSGTSSNRVMSSTDGITWTTRTSASGNDWLSVTYGNGLFVAVAETGTGDRVMTSPDGTTWTTRTSAADNGWQSVTFGAGLFVAVSNTGTGNRVMTSPDGINWVTRTSASDNNWNTVAYGNGVFVALSGTGTNDRVMSSGANNQTPFSANNTYQGGQTLYGALSVNLAESTGTAQTITLANTSGSQTNGLFIDRNGAGGTTTNAVNITNTAGTLTNGIVFNGTIGTDITAGASRTLSIAGGASTSASAGGTLSLQGGTAGAVAGSNGGAVNILGAAGTSTGTGGAGGTVTITGGAAGGSGNNNGGNIILQPGAATGSGTVGRVGVGTVSPSQYFHILGADSANPITLKVQNNTGGTSGDARLLLSTSATTSNDTTGAALLADRTDASSAGDTDLLFQTSSGATLNTQVTVKSGGATTFKNSTDSTAAFEVKKADNSTIFGVDTTNRKVTVGAYTAGNGIGQLMVQPTTSSRVGISIVPASGATVDALQVYDAGYTPTGASSSDNVTFRIAENGVIGSPGSSTASTRGSTFKSGDTSFAGGSTGAVIVQSGANTGTGNTGALTIQSGNATSGNSGAINIDTGTATGTVGAVNINSSSNGAVTIGNGTSTAGTISIQGGASTFLSATNATGTTKLSFQAPSTAGTVTFRLPAGGTGGNTYDICTTLTVCTGYAATPASGSYIKQVPATTAENTITPTANGVDSLTINGTSGTAATALAVNTTSATNKGVVITGAASQSANLLEATVSGTGYNLVQVDSIGRTKFRPASNTTDTFTIQNAAGTSDIFYVSGTDGASGFTGNVGINTGSIASLPAALTLNGALSVQNGNSQMAAFTTPLGANLTAKISVVAMNPGATNQILALGLTNAAPANARGILVADARSAGDNQPVISVLSPNENNIFGLSFDGSNTTAKLKAAKQTQNNTAGINVTVVGGQATGAATGGNASLIGGAGGETSGAGGDAVVQGGDAAAGNSNGGNVTIDAGAKTGSGTNGAVSIGATNATGVTIGGTTNTTSVLLQGAAAATYTVGTSNNTGGITIGNSTASNTISIGATAGGSATQTINIGTSATASSTTNVTIGSTIAGSTTLQSQTTNINSATIATNQTSLALFNTNAATVTALQAGTSISIGATTGTLTVRNANQTFGNAAGSGVFTNNGATLNSTLALGDFAGGGSIGSAATTVDIYTSISVAQTTASQTLTLAAPTANTAYGRIVYLSNIGSTSFTFGTTTINPGTTATLIWSNTNGGASWQFAGADGNGILNQNSADQSANFRISGTGRANTSFLTPVLDVATAGTLSVGTSTATAVNIGKLTVTTTSVGNFSIGASAGSGTLLTNNGATVNSTLALGDFAAGGAIGTAAATVDIYSAFSIAQTTASQTLTIPTPTANTTYGRIIYVTNIGITSFTLLGTTVNQGTSATLIWSNTNGGASWQFAGADGNGILNQNATDQTANFRISGTGRANTSFTSPLFDSISGGLSLGTSTATGVTIGGTTNTTSVLLQGAAAATYTVGTSNNTGGITIGNSTASNTIAIGNAATATGNTQTINIGAGTPAGTGLTAITIGNVTNTSSLSLRSGTGDIDLRSADLVTVSTSGGTAIATFNTSTTTTNVLSVTGALASSSSQNGINIGTTFSVANDGANFFYGLNASPSLTSPTNNLDTVTLAAVNGSATYAGTSQRMGTAIGGRFGVSNTGTRTLQNAYGVQILNTVNSGGGAVTSAAGLAIANQTVGTNNTNLLVGTTTIPTGSFNLYVTGGTGTQVAATINNGTSTGNILSAQDNGTNVLVVADGGNVGIKTGTTAPSADLTFGDTASRTINVLTRTTNAAGNNLTVVAGAAGAGASAFNGGALALQGGAAGGTGNATGGAVTIAGGAGTGTGVMGLISLAPTHFLVSGSTQVFGSNGSVTGVDSASTIPISASTTGITVTIPSPATAGQVVGRILYVANVGTTNDVTILLSGTSVTIALKPNSTATLIWNGNGWTAAGASSSTDLQAAYNNTATSAGGAELVLNAAGGAADGLTVRNNATTPIIGGLLEVQTSIGSNLFSVNNNATEYANNGGAETATFTMWPTAPNGGTTATITRTTAANTFATGQAAVQVVTTGATTANQGVANTLSATLTANLVYTVAFTVKGTTNFSTLDVVYSRDGTNTSTTSCATGKTVTQAAFSRVECSFTAPSSGITASNAIFIRQSDSNTVARTYYVDNLSVTVNANTTYAVDGSVDLALGTNWTQYDADGGAGTTTVTRDTTNIYDTSGAVSDVTTANANLGVRNNLAITPAVSTQYLVTFYAKLASGTFTDLTVGFLPAGGNGTPAAAQLCTDYSTQTLSTSTWTKITCIITTPSSGITDPDLVIYQPTGTARTFYVDALTMTLNTNNSSNVQIGGGRNGGPTTLFTLDRASTAPIAANNDAYLGSMYYDTSTGRIQCYEADGWGACGAAPDNIVNLNPEYAGAVLNGSGVGTMTADFCSNQGGVLSINSTLCSTGQAKNFYKWTSPQATQQTYSIYVTYQLPATFNGFSSDDTVQLVGRVDNTTNASITYEMYKSTGSAVTQCGTGETNVITGGGGSANTWYSYGISGNESTGCSFNSSSAGNFIIFKINLKANSGASAYVSTLSFTTTGR